MTAEGIPIANDRTWVTLIGVPNLLNMGFPLAPVGCGGWAKSHSNLRKLATPAGFEPATPSLEGWCSIRLSYGVMPSAQVYLRRARIERCARGFTRLTLRGCEDRDERHCRPDLRRFDGGLPAR